MLKNGLSSYQLKILAIIFMVIDHVNTYFGASLGWPLWVSWLGRFVAPLFVFLLVEGFFHTHSRKDYLRRLSLGAGIMLLGNSLINFLTDNYTNHFTGGFSVLQLIGPNNIFMTLALLFALIWTVDLSRENGKYLVVAGILLLPILVSEGGLYLLSITLIFYFSHLRENSKILYLGVFTICIALFAWGIFSFWQMNAGESLYQYLTFDNEFMMVTVLPLIYLYNGKRGGYQTRTSQYFFYVFYPLHLWVIYLLNIFL